MTSRNNEWATYGRLESPIVKPGCEASTGCVLPVP